MDCEVVKKHALIIRRDARRITESIEGGDSTSALAALERIRNTIDFLKKELNTYR